jgi:hypothetical protein
MSAKVFSAERASQGLQQSFDELLARADKAAILDGTELDLTLTTSFANYEHKLVRKYIGWHVRDVFGDARVWSDPANKYPEHFLRLRASAAVRVKVWVF